MWFEACDNPSMIKTRFRIAPLLDEIEIWDFKLWPDDESYLTLCGYIPNLPDKPNLKEGRVAEKTDMGLALIGLKSFSLTGVPMCRAGSLKISRTDNELVEFSFLSSGFQFSGTCQRAVINYVDVATTYDLNRIEPRGLRLFSHPNVWNTCLLLIQKYGYSLRVSGHSKQRDYICRYRWYATKDDGTELFADNPIELLGLVTLHRFRDSNVNEAYWWRIEGPPLMTDLMDAFEKESDPERVWDAESD